MKKTKIAILLIFLTIIFPTNVMAGGWSHLVSIESIDSSTIPYEINMEIESDLDSFKKSCKKFTLLLTPPEPKWWHGLPLTFPQTASPEEVQEAVNFLVSSLKENKTIILNPMGHVLSSVGKYNCAFNIKYLTLSENNDVYILQ